MMACTTRSTAFCRLGFAIMLASLASISTALAKESDSPDRLPNIVLVITDDQGYGELSCNGNPILKTPHLDRLASQSLRFTDFHVSPTCAPTRASLLTGRHEFKSGVTHTILERERLGLSATTIAQLLAPQYATGIFGKWHLGDEAAYQPQKRGFETAFIHGAGGIGQSYRCSCGDVPGNKYFDPVVRHNGTFKKTKGFCTDVFFSAALDWIEDHRDQPFFAMISTNAPHSPYIAPKKYAQPFLDQGLAKPDAHYYGMIANIDDNMARLMEKLDELKLSEETLLIFMTDNGHARGNLFNAGMRGMKGTPHEGGTRVPAFFRWPGHTPADKEVAQLTAHIDIFPTLAEIANVEIPSDLQLDGRSLKRFFDNPQAEWKDRYLFTHVGRWKKGEIEAAKFHRCAVRSERFRLVNNAELFDIVNDPKQTKNVIDEFPKVVADMRSAYDQWWADVVPQMVNEDVPMAAENPFRVDYLQQKENSGIPDWSPRSR